jgi:HEAT repeat protein
MGSNHTDHAPEAALNVPSGKGVSFDTLLLDLTNTDWSMRRDAALALGAMGPAAGEAVSALTKRLEDEHADVRRAVARALRRIGSAAESAVPALVERLTDEYVGVRRSVVFALEEITREGNKDAVVEALMRVALEDKNAEVRLVAAGVLRGIERKA